MLDGSHAYVAAHTKLHRSKMVAGDMKQAHIEAMVAFVYQFTEIDYGRVRTLREKQKYVVFNPPYNIRSKIVVIVVSKIILIFH